MSQYLRMFLDESEEYLQSLNQNLLDLENNPDDDQMINNIFRAAHSLKGMAATMGFDKMANLTHEMENILDRIRAKKMTLTTQIVDILFKCLDRLDKLVKEIANVGYEESDVQDIIKLLQNAENGAEIIEETLPTKADFIETNSDERNQIISHLKSGYYCYMLDVVLAQDSLLKAVRGFMVIKNLREVGIVVKSIPSVEAIEEDNFDYSFKVLYLTKISEKEIEEIVMDVTDTIRVEIQHIMESNLDNFDPFNQDVLQDDVVKEVAATVELEEKIEKPKNITQDLKVTSTVRVDIDKLDSLMNLVAELLINKTRLEEISSRKDFSNELLGDIMQQLDRVTMNLQHTVMQVRMVPIDRIFNRFPRMVRDLSKELNKKVNLIIDGAETELDRSIIDSLGDPLVHLLRNAIDHGIEDPETRKKRGKPEFAELRLAASQKGNEILIQVTDDGNGLEANKIGIKGIDRGLITKDDHEKMTDQEKVNLIFQPGFSTSDIISDISGRGVGLDVVRKTVESLDGHIYIDTELGKGTTFNISLPLTLAITQALLVKVCKETYAIPLSVIESAEDITPDQIQMVQGQEVFLLRGSLIPLVWAHKLLGLPLPDLENTEQLSVVVIRTGKKQIGLIVTELINQQDIVIKSLGEFLIETPHISGATILGDGEVALILDVRNIA